MASQKILVVSLGQFYHNDFVGREQSRDRLSHAHIDHIGNTETRKVENTKTIAGARAPAWPAALIFAVTTLINSQNDRLKEKRRRDRKPT